MMRYAFCSENRGYVPGRLGGLGSLHTAGVWPLGDAQEWLLAVLTGDPERRSRVEARWREVVAADRMLPETYDPQTREVAGAALVRLARSLIGLLDRVTRLGAGPW